MSRDFFEYGMRIENLTLPSPAKINLCLHIIKQRADGYHEIQTAFQFIDFCDTIDFSLRKDQQICLKIPIPGIKDSENLVVRAAHQLREKTQTKQGADIAIDKKLPLAAGLGGGSSNAATTLVGLNLLWGSQLSISELSELGLQLGADVPVFIHGHAAWAEGIGEILHPVLFSEPWYVLVIPSCKVETKQIYTHPRLPRQSSAITLATFLQIGGRNDCEALVKELYPEVAFALNWLAKYAPSRMTGTGSCVFVAFADKHQAMQAVQESPAELQSLLVKGLNHSPLQLTITKHFGV